MIFKIERASLHQSKDKPLNGAFIIEVNGEKEWAIEVKDLESLINLIKEDGNGFIVRLESGPTITIHDDYVD